MHPMHPFRRLLQSPSMHKRSATQPLALSRGIPHMHAGHGDHEHHVGCFRAVPNPLKAPHGTSSPCSTPAPHTSMTGGAATRPSPSNRGPAAAHMLRLEVTWGTHAPLGACGLAPRHGAAWRVLVHVLTCSLGPLKSLGAPRHVALRLRHSGCHATRSRK